MTDTIPSMPAKVYLTDDKGIILQHSMKQVTMIHDTGIYRSAEQKLTWNNLCTAKQRFLVLSGLVLVIPGVHTHVQRFDQAKTLMRGDAFDIDGVVIEMKRQ